MGYTLAGPRRQRQWWIRIYFLGLIAIAALLMFRQPVFFVFVITGFFHAYFLRPWPLMVLGILATSLIVNSMIPGFPDPTQEGLYLFAIVVVVQTTLISFGAVIGEKLNELSEQRRRAVTELETALEENAGLQAQLMTQAREAGVLDERQRMAA